MLLDGEEEPSVDDAVVDEPSELDSPLVVDVWVGLDGSVLFSSGGG